MNQTHWHNQRGFTLVELLLVLVIVGVISTVVMHFSHQKMLDYTYAKVVNQIELAVRMAQTTAIAEQASIYCVIEFEKTFVLKRGVYEQPFYEQELPEGMTVLITTPNRRIHFNASGTTIHLGKMVFIIDGVRTLYTINLGKGRFLFYE